MNRLTRYLVGLFASEAATLFAVAVSIIFLVECLRIVDVGSVRGQGLVSLIQQVFLALPSVARPFVHICIGIGLARALRSMQATRELHILHVSGRLPGLVRAVTLYAGIGAVLLLLVAHVVDPLASRENSMLRNQAAADLLGRSLVPNRFAEVTTGVTVTVGGRKAGGEITSFFADDRREPTRRTYISESAVIATDEFGYVLQLANGTVQHRTPEGRFSEVQFTRYDLAFDRLTGNDTSTERGDITSVAIIAAVLTEGWTRERISKLADRTLEGVRVLTICLFVFAIAGFPSGRRREARLPIELTVLGASFFERLLSTYAPGGTWLSIFTGVAALAGISLVILVFQVRPFGAPRRAVRT
jgi:lipopolysaccharide export system permease protein